MINGYPSGSPEWVPGSDDSSFDARMADAIRVLEENAPVFVHLDPQTITYRAFDAVTLTDVVEVGLVGLDQQIEVIEAPGTIALGVTPAYRNLQAEFIGKDPADGDLPRTLPFRSEQ
jgi:hypothetical protein